MPGINHPLAEKILAGKRPLYKYYSLGRGYKQRTLRVLRTERVWLAARSTLNDPFDCSPLITIPRTKRELGRALTMMVRALHPAMADSYQKVIVERALSKLYPITDRIVERFERDVTDWLDTAGVFCATTNPRHLLMWSHYADSHRGICIGFRGIARQPATGRAVAHPVQYTVRRPHVNPMKSLTESARKRCVLRKPKEWEYEDEWRLVGTNGPEDLILPRGSISGDMTRCCG